jgi:hypothetical protein
MKTLATRIASLSVSAKIAAIMVVLMFPIGHFAWLIAQSVQKDVAFSSLEVEGAKAVRDVWAGLAEAARPDSSLNPGSCPIAWCS